MTTKVERVLAGHFNGKPSELHYGCNKWVRPTPVKKKPIRK